jgi:hypothetical protein
MAGVEYRMPAPLNMEAMEDLYPAWLRFKQSFAIFISAAGLSKISEARKASILLNCIGQPAQELYFNTLKLNCKNEDDDPKLEEVISAFEQYFKPRSNEVISTWQFNKRIQEDGESFDTYYTELIKIVKNCNFPDQDRMLRDRIVVGIKDQRVQQRLLEIRDLTLERAVEICRSAELSREHARLLTKSPVPVVDAIQRKVPLQPKKSMLQPSPKAKYYNSNNFSLPPRRTYLCKKCNTEHGQRECPAYGKQCEHCKLFNHYKVGCKFINQVECIDSSEDTEGI